MHVKSVLHLQLGQVTDIALSLTLPRTLGVGKPSKAKSADNQPCRLLKAGTLRKPEKGPFMDCYASLRVPCQSSGVYLGDVMPKPECGMFDPCSSRPSAAPGGVDLALRAVLEHRSMSQAYWRLLCSSFLGSLL